MQIALNRAKRKLSQISFSGIIAGALFLFLIGFLAYRGYMVLESTRLSKEISMRQEELMTKKRELTAVQADPGYLKFMAAKYLEVQTKPMHREIKLKYLTDLLEELKAFNKTQRAVALANFQIDDTSITLQGTVENIAHMYKEGGIIDKFIQYPFIKYFHIPYYRKNENGGYEFLLDADIYPYDGSEPAS